MSEAQRFRKLPVEIEVSEPLTLENAPAIAAWVGADAEVRPGGLLIATLEGAHHASWGDRIVRGVRGEHYPVKPDIFAETYEPVRVAAGAGDPQEVQHAALPDTFVERVYRTVQAMREPTDDATVTLSAFEASAIRRGAGDRPPAPSEKPNIIAGIGAYLRWRESGDGSPSNLVHAILQAVGAVRPTPREALTVETLAVLLEEMAQTVHASGEGAYSWKAAWLLPRLGAASPAAPPQEES